MDGAVGLGVAAVEIRSGGVRLLQFAQKNGDERSAFRGFSKKKEVGCPQRGLMTRMFSVQSHCCGRCPTCRNPFVRRLE